MKNSIKKTILIFLAIMLTTTFAFAERDSIYPDLEITLLNQDPDPAVPGDELELRFQVEKPNVDTIKNISFELIESFPFEVDPTDEKIKVINKWIGYGDDSMDEHYLLYYKVQVSDDAKEGDYDLSLKYDFSKDYRKVSFSQEFTIRIGEDTNPEILLGGVQTSPTKLLADSDENKIEIEVLNNGEETAKNFIVQTILPKGFEFTYSGASKKNLGNIEGNSQLIHEIYLDLDEDLAEGSSKGYLNITYKDDNEYINKLLPFDLDIKNKPVFEIESYEFDKEKIVPGESLSLKLNLKNTGSKKAESVSIRAYKDSTQPFDFDEKSDFIGTLNSNENGEGLLTLSIDEDAKIKKYFLELEIRSIKNGQVFVQEELIPINVEEAEKKVNPLVIYLGAFLGVALISVISYKYGKNS